MYLSNDEKILLGYVKNNPGLRQNLITESGLKFMPAMYAFAELIEKQLIELKVNFLVYELHITERGAKVLHEAAE